MSVSEPLVAKITALFAALDREEVEALPQLRRDNFAELCAHWATVAGKRQPRPNAQGGVLTDLKQGKRAE